MRSRSFFYGSLGVLALTAAFHVGSRSSTAQSGTAPEVAILTGTLPNGEVIPLPIYSDGSQAQESECRWTVSPAVYNGSINTWVEFQRCDTEGRTVRVYQCLHGCGPAGDCTSPSSGCPGPRGGSANYFIVAVRNLAPTPARQESMGSVKARYR